MDLNEPLVRLMARVVVTPGPMDTPCWVSTYYRNEKGYAVMSVAGNIRRCHQVTYELLIGPIPNGLILDHLCRVPACCNPSHLEPVTIAENSRRGFEANGTGPYLTHCLRGHEFTEANTLHRSGGGRTCRACHNFRTAKSHRATRLRRLAA